ncbi:unnamed protein product [Schistosoma turkestanicum]|nr:unnamed protein product [Schistosoma turkestanicum]
MYGQHYDTFYLSPVGTLNLHDHQDTLVSSGTIELFSPVSHISKIENPTNATIDFVIFESDSISSGTGEPHSTNLQSSKVEIFNNESVFAMKFTFPENVDNEREYT